MVWPGLHLGLGYIEEIFRAGLLTQRSAAVHLAGQRMGDEPTVRNKSNAGVLSSLYQFGTWYVRAELDALLVRCMCSVAEAFDICGAISLAAGAWHDPHVAVVQRLSG